MKNKFLLAAAMIALALSISSCAYTDPRRQYPPVYRTYQDRDHGGMDDQHGGMDFNQYQNNYQYR